MVPEMAVSCHVVVGASVKDDEIELRMLLFFSLLSVCFAMHEVGRL